MLYACIYIGRVVSITIMFFSYFNKNKSDNYYFANDVVRDSNLNDNNNNYDTNVIGFNLITILPSRAVNFYHNGHEECDTFCFHWKYYHIIVLLCSACVFKYFINCYRFQCPGLTIWQSASRRMQQRRILKLSIEIAHCIIML